VRCGGGLWCLGEECRCQQPTRPHSTQSRGAAKQACCKGLTQGPLTDGDALRMDGAQVAVLKQVHHEILRSLLCGWMGAVEERVGLLLLLRLPRGTRFTVHF